MDERVRLRLRRLALAIAPKVEKRLAARGFPCSVRVVDENGRVTIRAESADLRLAELGWVGRPPRAILGEAVRRAVASHFGDGA